MIPLRSGSCLSPAFSGIKANSIEVTNIIDKYHISQRNLNTLALFAFTRFYLRVLADLNGIIQRLKQNVILRSAINRISQEEFVLIDLRVFCLCW